jgi:DnaJ-class molecular chaperone
VNYEDIQKALKVLNLPAMITKNDIKKQYRFLVKKNHPDLGGDIVKLQELNVAYDLLIEYVDNFKFAFDESEISKQLPFKAHFDNFKM